jgi:hypothetical protein
MTLLLALLYVLGTAMIWSIVWTFRAVVWLVRATVRSVRLIAGFIASR